MKSAFPQLQLLAIQGNALSGAYPDSYATAFAPDANVTTLPGNGALGAPDAGMSTGLVVGVVVGVAIAAGERGGGLGGGGEEGGGGGAR